MGVLDYLGHIDRINKTISPKDSLYPVYVEQYYPDKYFETALYQVGAMDEIMRTHTGRSLEQIGAVADFACHYGRLVRAFRAVLPDVRLYACDVDPDCVSFCAQNFGAIPVQTTWTPETMAINWDVSLIYSISLLTHTRVDFFHRVLELWHRIAEPNGLILFTFLGESYVEPWIRGEMQHYGPISDEVRAREGARFKSEGHAYAGFLSNYSTGQDYGVGFLHEDLVRSAVARYPDLQYLETRPGSVSTFGQDLAVVKKVG